MELQSAPLAANAGCESRERIVLTGQQQNLNGDCNKRP